MKDLRVEMLVWAGGGERALVRGVRDGGEEVSLWMLTLLRAESYRPYYSFGAC